MAFNAIENRLLTACRASLWLLLFCALPAFAADEELPLSILPGDPGVRLEASMAEVATVEHAGAAALRVRFAPGEWPNLMWQAGAEAWDWNGSTGLAVEVYNPETEAQQVSMRVDNPAVVGAHWFQYVDEPVTGRTLDGENYNIGFVDVTDTPYPELVEAARGIHAEIYRSRYNGGPESGTGGTP